MTLDRGHIETVIADLRRTHAQLAGNTPSAANAKTPREWSMRLTVEEVGALLAIVDERDELRRQTVGDWEPDFPPVTVEKHVGIAGIPAHWVDAETPPLSDLGREEREAPPSTVMHIAGRSGVLCGADRVSHVTDGRRFADCPACIEVYETRRCDAICDGDGGRSSCFTPWCRCTVCHGSKGA